MSNLTVAFVHIGTKPPKYLWKNIERFAQIFPNVDCVFISDLGSALEKANKLNVKNFRYTRELMSMPQLEHDFGFRGGFWHYSMERLFALLEWHESSPSSKVLHLESDVLLLPTFPFESFSTTSSLAWPEVNSTHDAASILFSPNAEESRWLMSEISQHLKTEPRLTDMTVLNRVRKANSARISTLPTWSETWEDTDASTSSLVENSKFFGVFDAATYGMWLTGRDPRNYWGWLPIHSDTPEHFVRPQKLDYSLDRQVLMVKQNGQAFPLHDLHIHSKQEKLFGQSWEQHLSSYVLLSADKNSHSFFVPKAFIGTLLLSLRGYLEYSKWIRFFNRLFQRSISWK